MTVATRYLVDNHGFSEFEADKQVRENLTYPANPVMVRPAEEARRKSGTRDRVIEFRYLTPPSPPAAQTHQDKALVDGAFPAR